MRLGFLLTLLLLLTAPATAAYKWIAPDGSVSFSDLPPHPDAEKVPLSRTQIFAPPPVKPATAQTPKNQIDKKPAPYSSITITQPTHDAAIRDNAGNITISVSVTPALRTKQGHKITITLDGAVVATNTSGQVNLQHIDRGSHTLSASVIDSKGTTLISSDASTFHLQRISIAR